MDGTRNDEIRLPILDKTRLLVSGPEGFFFCCRGHQAEKSLNRMPYFVGPSLLKIHRPNHKEKKVPLAYVAHPDEDKYLTFPGAHSYPIFNEGNTPVNACCAMFNVFFSEEYPQPGVHEDNEGFYVISGRGKMLVAGNEYDLEPGCAMYAPAGMPHAIKKVGSEDLRVFLYHFPK